LRQTNIMCIIAVREKKKKRIWRNSKSSRRTT